MANYLTMQNRVLDATQRPANADRTEIKLLVNDAYQEIAALLRLGRGTFTKTLVAGDGDYSISTDWLITDLTTINQVTSTQAGQTDTNPLEQITPEEMFDLRRFPSTGGQRVYTLLGLDTFMIWPLPSAGDTVTVYYTKRPAALVSDGDVPDPLVVPPEFHDAIVVRAICWAVRPMAPMSAQYTAEWERCMDRIRGWRSRMRGDAPRRVLIGYTDRAVRVRHDNSQDTGGGYG